ncbi:glycosyltransferase [Flavobacterium sp. TP390]|uniref:Glycosyltransferase n=1 Tax=Flavobacterium profundi TaxID=1774945 RepID=A0A6I4IDP5_9FLAO|nr:glycosyltransferase family 4 protein [Flavobacterium profundi]MVO07695.1 glycosyltransferase [Flavobacterium profundi]
MKSKRIAVVSHVNPFSKGSGQVERVYNTLLALAYEWEELTIYTLHENKSHPNKMEVLCSINKRISIVYVKNKKPNWIVAFLFKFLPYLGYGKESNFSIPFLFDGIEKELATQFDVVLFEYWHLYKLAKRLKNRGIFVICDTHNILLNSFTEFIRKKKWLPKIYQSFLIKKYAHLEFEIALKENFNLIIAINKEEENILKIKFPNQKIYYFPMGIKFNPIASWRNSKEIHNHYTIVYYGGLSSIRNSHAALQVIQAVEKIQEIEIHMIIVGSNAPSFLKDYIAKKKGITLLGFVENLEEAFEGVDLAVIPFEGKYGFRSRLIELMHYEIPILTTEDAIWGMGFKDKVNVLVSSGTWEKDIKKALKDERLRMQIAKNAKNKIEEEFTFENTYLKFVSDLIQIVN